MANAKVSTVTLECDALGVTEQFEITHAERLLAMHDNGGWKLPKNSEYEYKNGVISRRHKTGDTPTAKAARD